MDIANALPAETASSFTPYRLSRLVILLVEDEPVVREVTRRVREHAGYEVIECNGPDEALSAANQNRDCVQLLLSDVVMPGMNGPELARQLRQEHPA